MSDLPGLLADLARVAVVMAAVAALFMALAVPTSPIWTAVAVLAICAAVTVSRQSSPGAGDPLHAPGDPPTTQ